jgi:uncharacterized protein (TIGR03067 family)
MLRSTLAALMLAPILALGADDKPSKKELEELQGTWSSVTATKANGEELSPEAIIKADHWVTFSGDTMTNSSAGMPPVSFKIAIDPSKSPKEIDWTIRKGAPPRLGIYRIKDDTLEIAWGSLKDGRPTRPAALIPCPKDSETKWTYGLYRRVEEKKKP